jgi:hypothetical protein
MTHIHHKGRAQTATRPRLFPRNRLRRGPLVDLPLANLRTGNSLYCVGWRNEKSWFLTHEQYLRSANLHDESAHVTEKRKESESVAGHEIPEDDSFGFHRSTLPDALSDSVWSYSHAESFNPCEWEVKSWGWWENPAEPQPPPEPFPGTDKYSCVIGPGSWRDAPFIPSLKRKTAATKEKNLAKFAAEHKQLCAERKALFKVWSRKLRETLGSHGNSHIGGCYETENCPSLRGKCLREETARVPRLRLYARRTPLHTPNERPNELHGFVPYAARSRNHEAVQSEAASTLDAGAVRCGSDTPRTTRRSRGCGVS